jgi:hypothetical protein
MLYIYPALVIFFAGAILGGLASPFARAGSAAAFGRWAAWGVALTAGGAVVAAIALPGKPVLNGPIGATCPDTGAPLFGLLAGLAVTSVVAGVAVVASATVEGAKRAATEGTFGRLVFAIVAPYVALGALFVPLLCDYS